MFKKVVKIMAGIILLVLVLGVIAVLTIAPDLVEKSMNKVIAHEPYKISNDVLKIHEKLVIADWHSDSLLWNRDLLDRSDFGHMDIPRLQEGNVAIQMFTVVTKSPSGQNYDKNTADSDNITSLAIVQLWPPAAWTSLKERALYQASRLHRFAAKAPEQLRIVKNKNEMQQALAFREEVIQKGEKPPVLGLIGLEGCHALEGRLENLDTLYDAGYRMIGLLHFFDNEVGGSLHGISSEGLTDFGREVVRKLDEKSMIIDLAHSSPAVVDGVLELTTRPVVISHTGVYGACKSARNISDKQMIQIAKKGGLIAIGYWDGAVCDISPDSIVKSLRYAIDLVGEDHVALGSDFDGSTTTTFDTSELAVLTQNMMDAGFSKNEITKIMGGNSVRFLLAHLPD